MAGPALTETSLTQSHAPAAATVLLANSKPCFNACIPHGLVGSPSNLMTPQVSCLAQAAASNSKSHTIARIWQRPRMGASAVYLQSWLSTVGVSVERQLSCETSKLARHRVRMLLCMRGTAKVIK